MASLQIQVLLEAWLVNKVILSHVYSHNLQKKGFV